MGSNELKTLKHILEAGKAEFLEKGFQGASLRNIVKNAGVTTGAFYGYYNSKEELFDALVRESAEYFMSEYEKVQYSFKELTPEEQEAGVGQLSGKWILEILDYMYDHFDAFKLIIKGAQGTKYENFVHELVEIEVEATHDFISLMESCGKKMKNLDPWLEHILVSGMFDAFFEIVVHDIPKNQAKEFVRELWEFQTAGWLKVMGL